MSVRIEKENHVWTIIYSRPEVRNGMDPDSAQALMEAFLEFENDLKGLFRIFFFLIRLYH